MIYTDRLYGTFTLDEPLVALLQSQTMQRLDGVLQHGITGLLQITKPISRLEHSIGVMLLINRLGGSLEEQIAGLLHDVSHTAFSHVIDYVFADGRTQSYHDEVKESYLQQSDIPTILATFGFDWKQFLEEEQYPILEQDPPALCADRIDYFFRDAVDLGLATFAQVEAAYNDFIIKNGRIMMQSLPLARWMAETYMLADDKSWSNYFEIGLYHLTAQAIKRGLTIGEIPADAIWWTDAQLWQALQQSKDTKLQQLLTHIHPQTVFFPDANAADFWALAKIRSIDPELWLNGEPVPLSKLDDHYRQQRESYHQRKSGKQPYRIKAISR